MSPVHFGALTEGQKSYIQQQNTRFYGIGEHATRCFGQPEDRIERRLEAEGEKILNGAPLAEDSFTPSDHFRDLETALIDAFDDLEDFAERNDGGLNCTHRKFAQYVLQNIRDCETMYVSDTVVERIAGFMAKCDENDAY